MLVLALSGCDGDPAENQPVLPTAPSSSAPTSPSSAPSATPSAPALAPEAIQNTKAGAAAFVRHYIAVINHAQATGDLAALDAIESRDCKSCNQVRQALATLYGSGGRLIGGGWRPRIVSVLWNDLTDTWDLVVKVTFDKQIVQTNGAADKTNAAGRLNLAFETAFRGGNWQVRSWTRLG